MKTNTLKIATFSVAIATAAMVWSSCNSLTKTQKGAGIGAVAGGALGAIIGKKAGNTAVGALIGGAVGGTAGAFIGRKMDRQAAEIKENVPGAEVTRAGEGLIVKFPDGILFDFNKTDVKAAGKNNVDKLATSMENNPDTDILIVGHTDNVGSESYNIDLSKRRAQSVKSLLVADGVNGSRLKTDGRGKGEPIADNGSAEGRAQNRRVEIVIVANDKMKEDAKTQSGN